MKPDKHVKRRRMWCV